MLPCARFKNKLITLKTKALSAFYLITALLLVSFSDPYSIKRISDINFRYEFYTTDKKINPKNHKTYYWFKGGLIHNAQGGLAGELLDGKFIKMYHSNQLAEQGSFKKGLKTGLWKTWYPNGKMETAQKWSNGIRSGKFYHYDPNGGIMETGSFKSDKKHGTWIDYVKKDTLIYKKGEFLMIEPKLSKKEKAESKEAEKKYKAERKAEKEQAKTQKKTSGNEENTSTDNSDKRGFFGRLFGKKQPNENVND